jgi:phage major head subunit gpT-like protein
VGIVIPENFGAILEPGLREVFFAGYGEVPEMYNKVFHTFDSTQSTETDQDIVGLGDWDQIDDGDVLQLDELDEGYSVTYEHLTYKKGFKVTRDLLEDDRYHVFSNQAKLLGRGAAETRENKCAAMFNNAFSASYPGGDAVALCSDSHPYKTLSGTQDNKATAVLATDALKDARTGLLSQLNERKQAVTFSPTLLLVVPPELHDTALVLTNSRNEPGTANNDINVNQGRYTVICLPHMTSATGWFLVDPAVARLNFFWRVKPDFRQAEILSTDAVMFRGRMRFSCGFSDWRGIWGSDGTA